MRDFDKSPYSADENRVAEFFVVRGVGGGDDPIGFILSSYEYVVAQRNHFREALMLARIDLQNAVSEIDRELRQP